MLLILFIMFPTLLAPNSDNSDTAEKYLEKYPVKYPVKYRVEENLRNNAVAPLQFLSVENEADNVRVRAKRWTKKKKRNPGSKKGKGGKTGKGKRPKPKAKPKPRPKPNQPCSKNPSQLKCTNKKFSSEIKRIKGQLNNFVASSSLQKFKKNLRAELAEATRVVPDLVRLKATVEQEMKTNNQILKEVLASLAQVSISISMSLILQCISFPTSCLFHPIHLFQVNASSNTSQLPNVHNFSNILQQLQDIK